MLAHKLRRASGWQSLSVTYIGRSADETDQTTYTFSGVSVGSAGNRRAIIVGVSGWRSTDQTISSLTIGGVTATFINNFSNSSHNAGGSFWAIFDTSTTSADIVVTFTGAGTQVCQIAIWNIFGLKKLINYDRYAEFGNPTSGSLLTRPSGVVLAMAQRAGAGGANFTLTGVTEDYDVDQLDGASTDSRHAGGSATTSGGSLTVGSSGNTSTRFVAISF